MLRAKRMCTVSNINVTQSPGSHWSIMSGACWVAFVQQWVIATVLYSSIEAVRRLYSVHWVMDVQWMYSLQCTLGHGCTVYSVKWVMAVQYTVAG